jgi:hypothetical protein
MDPQWPVYISNKINAEVSWRCFLHALWLDIGTLEAVKVIKQLLTLHLAVGPE